MERRIFTAVCEQIHYRGVADLRYESSFMEFLKPRLILNLFDYPYKNYCINLVVKGLFICSFKRI